MNILILGSARDPHVFGIRKYLEAKGVEVTVFDINGDRSFRLETTVFNSVMEVAGRPFHSFSAVLNRMKWHNDVFVPDTKAYAEYFYATEWIYALRGILAVARLIGLPVINDPWRSYFGGNKLAQLFIAERCGLQPPPSLISSDARSIELWSALHPDKIAKIFDATYVPALEGEDSKAIFTVAMTDDDVRQYIADVKDDPPFILQHNVQKQTEARVIASRTDEITYLIESQRDPLAAQDWRLHEAGVSYVRSESPPSVVSGMRKLLVELDLDYGVFDFAIGEDGSWTFFECNPDGQWWLPRRRAGGAPERIIGDVLYNAAAVASEPVPDAAVHSRAYEMELEV